MTMSSGPDVSDSTRKQIKNRENRFFFLNQVVMERIVFFNQWSWRDSADQLRKCHARTMMHSEVCEAYKMNAHHVPLRQNVEEIRLGKT